MKKKFLAVILLASTLCIGFSACGDEDNKPQKGGYQQPENEIPTIDGFEFVDLGLSVKWASCNVGADWELGYGGFFQYGNPESFNFLSDYQLPTENIGGTSKDPAFVHMSRKWRMPTRAEMIELKDNCDWIVAIDSRSGQRYYVGTSQFNGEEIYIPAAGAYPLGGSNNSILYENEQCWLMTSTLDGSGNPRPYILKIQYISSTNSSIDVTTNEAGRYSGMPIRAVSTAAPDDMKAHGVREMLIGSWRWYDENDKRWYSILKFNEDGTGIYVEKHTPDDMTYTLDLSSMFIYMRFPDWNDDRVHRAHITRITEDELVLEWYYYTWDGEKNVEIEIPETQHYYRYSGSIPAKD